MDLQILADNILKILKHPIFSFANKYTFRANVALNTAQIGVYDRWILSIQELQPSQFLFSIRDTEAHRNRELSAEIQGGVEMFNLLLKWSDKIEWWASRLTRHRLQPDKQYRVLQDFTDYYGKLIKAETKLSFLRQSFVPYHGGYTVMFAEMTIYLQEDDHAAILSDFDLYFEEIS